MQRIGYTLVFVRPCLVLGGESFQLLCEEEGKSWLRNKKSLLNKNIPTFECKAKTENTFSIFYNLIVICCLHFYLGNEKEDEMFDWHGCPSDHIGCHSCDS
jgi:hypothetical protein